jgi:RNA polymerase sigma-70 factor, ECF subfamily
VPDQPIAHLADRVRARDPAALAAFLEHRRPALLAFVERRLGSALRGKLEPQDVLQELAVKALRELPNADLSTRDPFGWLCHLAEQCIVDDHRHFAAGKRASGREVPGNVRIGDGSQDLVALLAASLTSPSMAVVKDERQRRLMDVVATLPDEHQQALRLRYGEGLPTKDVAQKLGKSDVATRVLLSRLVQQLQDRLEE